MPKSLFISLPVSDLGASIAFYKALGFGQNPQLSDEDGAAMVWSDAINVMLLTHGKWRTFTSRPIPPPTSSEVSLALALDGREDVDAMIAAAVAHGGTGDINPAQDLGFMYGRDLIDPDGHVWGPFWMDMAAMPAQ